jgi:signal transduction histidine kinase
MTAVGGGTYDAPGRARRSLTASVLVLRWLAFAWMLLGNAFATESFRHPALAWALIGAAGVWTVWLTALRERESLVVRLIDLAFSAALIVLSGVVVDAGSVLTSRLFFAATYPLGTALAWGEAGGIGGGLIATAVMGVALVFSRIVNGVSVGSLSSGQIASMVNGSVAYLLAALAGGATSFFLDRWEVEQNRLVGEAMEANARAARLAERDALARQIHDSVLQALALVRKRGRELASGASISGPEVAQLAELAGAQEEALRALILREPDKPPTGRASLRDSLEQAARGLPFRVGVSAVGPIWTPANVAAEMSAAVRQALENVAEHANASDATVFAEMRDGTVSVSVRDNGRGFVYDEEAFRAAGKAGMLKSMKGRVEALGGTMHVQSAPGKGTEIEFTVPVGADA